MIVRDGDDTFLVPLPPAGGVTAMIASNAPQVEKPSWPRLERWLRDYGLVVDAPAVDAHAPAADPAATEGPESEPKAVWE